MLFVDVTIIRWHDAAMITPAQSRAARALVDWSQQTLATQAGVSLSTIRDFEGGKRVPVPNNLGAIKRALESAGVRFLAEGVAATGGVGVRFDDGRA